MASNVVSGNRDCNGGRKTGMHELQFIYSINKRDHGEIGGAEYNGIGLEDIRDGR